MIHRVVFGSVERFIGVITEHFAGAFPLWLAPEQIRILPIADRHHEASAELLKKLEAQGFRGTVDTRSEKTGYKIREALLKKIPYIIVLGDKDIENGTVSVRRRGEEGTTAMKLEDFIALAKEQVESKEIF